MGYTSGASTVTIEGINFLTLPPEKPEYQNRRGRKSPTGGKTKLPFNKFMWQLLDKAIRAGRCYGNEDKPITDQQMIAILKEEFAHVPVIMKKLEKPSVVIAQARSHFNHNFLVSGYNYILPSFSLNPEGKIIDPDSGSLKTKEQVEKRLRDLGITAGGELDPLGAMLHLYGFTE